MILVNFGLKTPRDTIARERASSIITATTENKKVPSLPHESFRVGCFKKNKPKADKIKNNEQKL